jgi:hypothetical protein
MLRVIENPALMYTPDREDPALKKDFTFERGSTPS